MNKKLEYRSFVLNNVESGEGNKLVGYASVFNSPSFALTDNQGRSFVEVISPSAFNKTLSENRAIVALYNHDMSRVLGSVKANTLRLTVDSKGLRAEVDLPNTSFANDLRELVSRGDLDSMSFGFQVIQQSRTKNGNTETRTISEVKLFEVSYGVPYPAYSGANGVSVRDVFGLDTEPVEAIDSNEKLNIDTETRNQLEDTKPEEVNVIPATKPSVNPILLRARFL